METQDLNQTMASNLGEKNHESSSQSTPKGNNLLEILERYQSMMPNMSGSSQKKAALLKNIRDLCFGSSCLLEFLTKNSSKPLFLLHQHGLLSNALGQKTFSLFFLFASFSWLWQRGRYARQLFALGSDGSQKLRTSQRRGAHIRHWHLRATRPSYFRTHAVSYSVGASRSTFGALSIYRTNQALKNKTCSRPSFKTLVRSSEISMSSSTKNDRKFIKKNSHTIARYYPIS